MKQLSLAGPRRHRATAAAAGKAFFVPDLSNRRRQGGSSAQWGYNRFEVAINLSVIISLSMGSKYQ